MPWLSERHWGSRLDTWPSLLRTAQPQGGGWYLVAKSRLSETEGLPDGPGDPQAQATTAGLGGLGKGRGLIPRLPR